MSSRRSSSPATHDSKAMVGVEPYYQRLCAWCGPLLMLSFGLGFCVIAGFVPPPAPGLPAAEVARFYGEHATRIRIGLVISMLGAGLAIPFPVIITLEMRRIPGASALALVQLIGGLFNTVLFVFPMFAMAAATYRATTRSPEITQALSDLGWLALVGFGAPAIFQTVAIALAVFRDHQPDPVFPRWFAYFNLWCAVLFVPGLTIICFLSGPLAWNGVFAFWVPLTIFGAWFVVTAIVLIKGIDRREHAPVGPDVDRRSVPVN